MSGLFVICFLLTDTIRCGKLTNDFATVNPMVEVLNSVEPGGRFFLMPEELAKPYQDPKELPDPKTKKKAKPGAKRA